jgi:hypothetical protein
MQMGAMDMYVIRIVDKEMHTQRREIAWYHCDTHDQLILHKLGNFVKWEREDGVKVNMSRCARKKYSITHRWR